MAAPLIGLPGHIRCPRTSLRLIGLLATLAGPMVGCSNRPYEVAPVSGVVTLDEQPLASAIVNTQPLGSSESSNPGPGSFGKTNELGEFTLELVAPAEPGAVVGTHRVVIRIPEELSASDELRPRKRSGVDLPVRALDGSLRMEVPAEGRTDANFDLTSRRPRRR